MDQRSIEIIGACAGVLAVFLALLGIIITYLLGDDPGRDRVNRFFRGCFVVLLVVGAVGGVVVGGVYLATNAHLGQSPTAHAASTTYTAVAPGPNCDRGSGLWGIDTQTDITLTCQSNGLLVQYNNTNQKIGSVFFYGSSAAAKFPSAYSIQVSIAAITGDVGAWAGVGVHRVNNEANAQVALVTASGGWELDRYLPSGPYDKTLGSGSVSQTTKYVLAVDVRGDVLTVRVNGKKVTTVTDPTYTHTDYLDLEITGNVSASAVFSNFVYTADS